MRRWNMTRTELLKDGKQQADEWLSDNWHRIKAKQVIDKQKALLTPISKAEK